MHQTFEIQGVISSRWENIKKTENLKKLKVWKRLSQAALNEGNISFIHFMQFICKKNIGTYHI